MSTTKFTAGPWDLDYDKNHDWELSTDEEVITLGFADYSPNIHNAHLMKASPLLYKALEDLLVEITEMEDQGECDPNWCQDGKIAARKALKSARGES